MRYSKIQGYGLYIRPLFCYGNEPCEHHARMNGHMASANQRINMEFKIHSEYKPTGDQPQAIEALVKGFKEGNQFQTLLGVTGSGKTFTMANVIQGLQKPTLIIAHNKTLAGQLYGEMKEFFPENAVEYFVSYYIGTAIDTICCA